MSENKWTPGPWKAAPPYRKGQCVFIDAPTEWLAMATVALPDAPEHRHQQGLANASLIAAAPDLYEALAGLVEATVRDSREHNGISGFTGARLSDAREALAKARGEQA